MSHIKTYVKEREIERIYKLLKEDRIRIPFIQRGSNKWDFKKKSLLIDSIFKYYPIPPIYLFSMDYMRTESEISSYYIIDGLQRITTIVDFMENKFKLQLDDSKDNNITFENLSEQRQSEFKETLIRTYEISSLDSDNLFPMIELFHRLNTGGVSLSDEDVFIIVLSLNLSSTDYKEKEEVVSFLKESQQKYQIGFILFFAVILIKQFKIDFFPLP